MKTSKLQSIILIALMGSFSAYAQSADTPSPRVSPTKPAAPELSAQERTTQKAASQARFAAMSKQEKAANKGSKQRPVKPAAPTVPNGRK